METLACVIHQKKDLRLQTVPVPELQESGVLVRIGASGICGSDLHYYLNGGFGNVRLQEPMVLGHEVAGTVEAVGTKVVRVKPGDRIALNPSRPCGKCLYCLEGNHQHCLDMKFYGSAMPMPHSQGAFRRLIVAEESQCEPVGDTVSLGEAACAEPLAVALHAVAQCDDLDGKRVLVAGAGSIGSLVVAAARWAGAAEVVALDLNAFSLRIAAKMGATGTIDLSVEKDRMQPYSENKGYFDASIECTGAPKIFSDLAAALRPRGTLVQVGIGAELSIPSNLLVGKEIRMLGAFRFDSEYALAARLLRDGRINVKPIITATLPLERAVEALETASDRTRQMKVQLDFETVS